MYTVSQIAWSVNLTLKFNIIYAIEKKRRSLLDI